MSDPSPAVRAAFLERLRTALAGIAKVYDEIPSTRSWPYVALRAVQTIPDDTGCSDDSEVNIDFDVWSKRLDHSETGNIAGLIRAALKTDLTPTGHAIIIQELVSVQFTGDPDPTIARAALSLRLETTPA